jgi:hypothetical protein
MNETRKAVVAILEHDGKILIGKKKTDPQDPLSGINQFPEGKNEIGESDKLL